MKIRKHGNPAVTGAGIVARVGDQFFYLAMSKEGVHWVGGFTRPIDAFRAARAATKGVK